VTRRTTLILALVLLCLPQAASAADPRYELEGEWSFSGLRFELVESGGTITGRLTEAVRVRGCRLGEGTKILSGFKFDRADKTTDVWRGTSLVIREGDCRKRKLSSKITVESDEKFTEKAGKLRAAVYKRVPPEIRDDDPVIGTWTRNNAGVIVKREGSRYVGTARESYAIANGCTIQAGTIVWRLEPLAPGRYRGTIQTFLQPPGCRPGALTRSTWQLSADDKVLTRVADDGQLFPYSRAP
jgi:hypothetical protein